MLLYKYRPFNKNTFAILRNSQLFFPKKSNLNDPFEFSVKFHARCSWILGPVYFWKNAGLVAGGIDPSTATKSLIARRSFSRKAMYDAGKLKKMEQALRNQVDSAGILCLSAIPDSVLMWSHYSEDHHGVCLVFDTTKDKQIFSTQMWKVRYAHRFPTQNILSLNPQRKFRTFLTTKSKVWKYEKEYRYLFTIGGQSYPFESSALTGVIFGYNASIRNKNRVRSILRNRGIAVSYFKAFMDKTSYVLRIEPE